MAQSSIHIEKVTTGSFLHNDRTMKPSYLIDDSALNECSRSSQETLEHYYKLKAEAEHNYTERTGQKMQKSTVLLKEAIVNLEAHHTLKDLQPIIKELEGYGFTVLQSAIHRDEGFLNDDSKEKNYHAHITMFNLNPETGKSVKLGKNYRQELSKLQTMTADTLKMERGKVSVEEEAKKLGVQVEKASKRLGTHTYKRAMVLKENATKELTQEIKAKDYSLKEYQARIVGLEGANTELRKELHALNRDINKTQDLEEKERKIAELEAKLTEQIREKDEKIEKIEAENTELKEQITTKDQTIDQLKNIPKEVQKEFIQDPKLVQENSELRQKLAQKDSTISETFKLNSIGSEANDQIAKINEIKEPRVPEPVPIEEYRQELEAVQKTVNRQGKENFVDNIIEKHSFTVMGVGTLDKKELAKELKTEFNKIHTHTKKAYEFNTKYREALGKVAESVKEFAKNTRDRAINGVEKLFNKIAGKTITEHNLERTEQKRELTEQLQHTFRNRSEIARDAQKEMQSFLDKHNKEQEQTKAPSKGMGLSR